jgi:flavin-binding protein dodecin
MSLAKHIEITAESNESFDDAIAAGIADASKTVRIKDQQVFVDDGQVTTYRVNMKLTFIVSDS